MNKKISFTGLVNDLRYNGKEYKGSIMDEEDKALYCTAADVLEDLLQSVAEWTAKYEEARDRCNLAEKQLFFMENLVRCGNCKYWHEVDDVDGTTYGECKRKPPMVRCIQTALPFEYGKVYPICGWNNGVHIIGVSEQGDPVDLVCHNYGDELWDAEKTDGIECLGARFVYCADGERKDGENE